jgi:hypothetical protein
LCCDSSSIIPKAVHPIMIITDYTLGFSMSCPQTKGNQFVVMSGISILVLQFQC